MRYKNKSIGRAVLALILGSSTGTAAAEDGKLLMSFNFDSLKGNFGQTRETKVKSLTTSVIYVGEGYRAALHLPYVEITGPGVLVGGTVARSSNGAVNSTSGVGDALATLAVDLIGSPQKTGFSLGSTALVKMPTGDEKKGLGTGKTDYGLQADLGFRPLPSLGFTATLGRFFYGQSPQIRLNDGNYTTVGVNFAVTRQLSLSASASRRDALTDTSKVRKDRSVGAIYALSNTSALQLNYTKGESQASPDSVVSAGLVLQF